MKRFIVLFLISLTTYCFGADKNIQHAGVKLAPIFANHMVLQQNEPIVIWGTAEAGQRLKVILGDEELITTSDTEGNWLVSFSPRKASKESLTLQVNELLFKDILIGEVWICSGQSNMGVPMQKIKNKEQYFIDTNNPYLRINSYSRASGSPDDNVWKDAWLQSSLNRCNTKDFFRGKWEVPTLEIAEKTSSLAWILGSKLQKKLDVPVGIIKVGVGGSAMNNWIPPAALKKNPATASLFEKDWLTNKDVREQHKKRMIAAFKNVMGECKPRIERGKVYNDGEAYLIGKTPYRWMCEPGFLFEAGIAPLKHLSFRGVLWYQGESDASNDTEVERAKVYFPLLLKSWRTYFGRDFPFLYVQLPGFQQTKWCSFREIQRNTELSLPNLTMIVTIDTGEEKDIHPKDKGVVADRAVHMALRNVYGFNQLLAFPKVVKCKIKKDKIVLRLTECNGGILPINGELNGFELADESGVFYKAKAYVSAKDEISVISPVKTPDMIRYAWQPYPKPALQIYNKQNLPLGPFKIKL